MNYGPGRAKKFKGFNISNTNVIIDYFDYLRISYTIIKYKYLIPRWTKKHSITLGAVSKALILHNHNVEVQLTSAHYYCKRFEILAVVGCSSIPPRNLPLKVSAMYAPQLSICHYKLLVITLPDTPHTHIAKFL